VDLEQIRYALAEGVLTLTLDRPDRLNALTAAGATSCARASSWFPPRVVGISRASEWTMTGRVSDAAEALDGGLVRAVHPAEALLPAA
jgi:enoyl-CoA hydratase/carnithine racemase